MTPAQTAALLAMCAAYDQRTIGQADVAAWHAALDGIHPDDARAAVVAHYRRSRERIMPADVVAAARRARADRLAAGPEPVPDADPSDPAAYIAALRGGRARAADPTTRPRPLAALLAPAARATRLP